MRTIGLRYERLLFLAAPLALASLLVFFVSIGSEEQQDLAQTKCLELAANAVQSQKLRLEKAWDVERLRIDSRDGTYSRYELEVKFVWIETLLQNNRCYSFMDAMDDRVLYAHPDTLSANLRKLADAIPRKPLNFYGVELPEKASISIFGTLMKIDLLTLTLALQIALAPVLLLWLGNLYNTRQRETLYIARMHDVRALFPHIVNVYPVGEITKLRKRSWGMYYANIAILQFFYPLVRTGLVALFVAPPVIFYDLSLYYMGGVNYTWVLGVVVTIFSCANLFAEWLPWHASKHFPTNLPA